MVSGRIHPANRLVRVLKKSLPCTAVVYLLHDLHQGQLLRTLESFHHNSHQSLISFLVNSLWRIVASRSTVFFGFGFGLWYVLIVEVVEEGDLVKVAGGRSYILGACLVL